MKVSAQATIIAIIFMICLMNVHVEFFPSTSHDKLQGKKRVEMNRESEKQFIKPINSFEQFPMTPPAQFNQRLRQNTMDKQPTISHDTFREQKDNAKRGKQQNAKKLLTRNFNAPRAIEGMVVPKRKTRLPKRNDRVQSIPIYYINLRDATARRKSIEKHLNSKKLKYTRVEAVSSTANVDMKVVSSLSNMTPNEKEIACIASHLVAIHTALHDTTGPYADSPYAIIIEDDVQFEFDVNLNELVYNAPEDFDVLQLLTSNEEQTKIMFDLYKAVVEHTPGFHGLPVDEFKHRNLWERRGTGINLWSTQAYAIRKEGIRDLIDSMVQFDAATQQQQQQQHYKVTLRNTNRILNSCDITDIECRHTYPFRLVADIYIYDLLGTAYTCRVPLLNGGGDSRGLPHEESGIQGKEKHLATKREFAGISEVVRELRQDTRVLPSSLLIS